MVFQEVDTTNVAVRQDLGQCYTRHTQCMACRLQLDVTFLCQCSQKHAGPRLIGVDSIAAPSIRVHQLN